MLYGRESNFSKHHPTNPTDSRERQELAPLLGRPTDVCPTVVLVNVDASLVALVGPDDGRVICAWGAAVGVGRRGAACTGWLAAVGGSGRSDGGCWGPLAAG